MNNDNPIQEERTSIPANAVSIYGQADAMEDFPVLKAFQQYIDAEQAKAQKRMTTLCIFFALIMIAVIGVFVLLLANVSQRNNTLNDQLINYMMKDRDRGSSVVVQQPVQNDTAIKSLTESMTALQKQMADQQAKVMEQQSKFFEQQAKSFEERAKRLDAAKEAGPTKEQIAQEKKNKSDAEKIRKATALLTEEKNRLDREKERLRRQEIELQRRRLYPELYEEDGTLRSNAGAEKAKPAAKSAAAPKKNVAAPKKNAAGAKRSAASSKPILYFDDLEDIELDVNGQKSTWTLPLD